VSEQPEAVAAPAAEAWPPLRKALYGTLAVLVVVLVLLMVTSTRKGGGAPPVPGDAIVAQP